MGLKLKVGLNALELRRGNGRLIDVAQLSSLDRDLLKDTLGVVKRFKAMLRQRFRLDLPPRNVHNALDDAVMAALAFIKLRDLLARR